MNKLKYSIRTALAMSLLVVGFSTTELAKADSFTPTGSMNTPRQYHTATLLPNGLVLVVGGANDTNYSPLSSAELYDPITRTWSPTGSMSVGRLRHTATLLPDGKVLIVGGFDGLYNVYSSAELYDPVSGIWRITGSMNNERLLHCATLLSNGKVLVTGGESYYVDHSSAELYDPVSERWAAAGSMSINRLHSTTVVLANGKVLAPGGYSYTTYANVDLYSPDDGTWTATGSLNQSRYGSIAVLLPNGRVIMAGGQSRTQGYSGDCLSSTELYDPATGNWSMTGSMGFMRVFHSCTLLQNGSVLAAGGAYNDGGIRSSAELYASNTGTWIPTQTMIAARVYHQAVLLRDGRVLIVGGLGTNGVLSSAELYSSIEITTQPQAQTGYWGKSVSFSVSAASDNLPLTYQWLKDGVPIEGATGSQLVLSDLKDTDAGNYTVTITDAANNFVTSQAPATLTVLPDVSIATYAGLTIKGGVGQTYGIQATTDLSNPSGWAGVANVQLTQATQIWYDANSTTEQPRRFYRVVAGPISIP